jgi:hypothetical protein
MMRVRFSFFDMILFPLLMSGFTFYLSILLVAKEDILLSIFVGTYSLFMLLTGLSGIQTKLILRKKK